MFGAFAGDILQQAFNVENQNNQQKWNERIARDAFNREADFAREMQRNGATMKMGDLRKAGLSPAFMNGAMLASSPLSAHSSAPSMGAIQSPSFGSDISQASLMDAQAKNLGADANNKEADTEVKRLEAERKKIENEYLPALKEREVNLMDGDIRLKGSQINYTDEQQRNLAQQTLNLKKEVEKINVDIEEVRARIANLEPDTVKKWIDAYYALPQYEATIKKLQSEAHLNYTQADDLVKTRVARIFNLNATGLHSYAEYEGLDIQNGRLAIQLDLDKDFSRTERTMDIILKPIHAIGDAIGSFAPFVTRKVKTESNVRSRSESTSHVTSNSMSENHIYNHTPRSGKRKR